MAEVSPPWFVDVTQQVGIDFVHDAGPLGTYLMPQLTGGGAALFDADNDGRLDVYLVQNGGAESSAINRLFRQTEDGHFEDSSSGSGLDVAGLGQGVAIGDVNNDGYADVLLTEYGRSRLFLNQGGERFQNVTDAAGLANLFWGTSASFLDYDRDGWLDLVIANYVNYDASKACSGTGGQKDFCGPDAFTGRPAKLFRNLGAETSGSDRVVAFADVTSAAGLDEHPGPGLGVFCADFDGDGWADVLVTNDGKPNHLWINQRNGTFIEEALFRGLGCNNLGQSEANMGVAVGDVDGDGLFDLFVTHLTDETHRLWKQGPRGYFQDHTGASDLAREAGRSTGFGAVMADFDHDGEVDLVLVNGRVARAATSPAAAEVRDFWVPYRERNILYANDGHGQFRNISDQNPELCGEPGVFRGVACGDVDGDGALDLLVTRVDGPARLYRNVATKRGHWLMVRALDAALQRDAYGAEIVVHAGGRRWVRWLNPGYSYVCSHDPRVHFGLGAATRVDRIEVLWPDGTAESFLGCEVDQHVTVRKGEGHPAKAL